MSKYFKSPIYYPGNKYKLLKQIKQYFPNKIDTFYDVFGGSGTISLNMLKLANNVVYNEFDKDVFSWFLFFKENEPEKINKEIVKILSNNNIPFNINSRDIYSKNKKNWYHEWKKAKEYFKDAKLNDKNLNMYQKIIWVQYNFSNDRSGVFRIGTSNYNEQNFKRKMYGIYNKNIKTLNGSFEDLMDVEFNKDDFLYFDPPYWNTNANYNNSWTWELETKLLNWLDKLTTKGIKWAFSNVFEHKGKINAHLKEWSSKNNYQVFYPKIQYSLGPANKSKKTIEVFITNYDPHSISEYNEQLSFELFGGKNESN